MPQYSASDLAREFSEDTPIKLAKAASMAFPDGSMSASGLRRQAAKGLLAVEKNQWPRLHHPASNQGNEGKMPRRSKGPRLWLRRSRREKDGKEHGAIYVILDKGRQIPTGCGADESDEAEQALASYIAEKHYRGVGKRDPTQIPVADVLSVYLEDVVHKHARPDESRRRIKRIGDFFGDKLLSAINGQLCRAYAKSASTDAMARRDLEELRAAINHHRREGLHDRIVSVVLPERRPPRERWLDRREVAKLLWTAWRRPKCKQLARFILFALYSGRRSTVVCRASFRKEPGRTWVDVDRGFLWPPERAKKTKKRNPPSRIAKRLLPHLRRWRNNGHRYVVGWGNGSTLRIDRTMKEVAIAAGLGDDVTPHVLRHTAATWLMQAGVDMLEAGQFLGMTTRTLEETYAHFRPDHLEAAANAFFRSPRAGPMKGQRFR